MKKTFLGQNFFLLTTPEQLLPNKEGTVTANTSHRIPSKETQFRMDYIWTVWQGKWVSMASFLRLYAGDSGRSS